ncbi:NifU family protein [Insolitispirillum peregrinum]|uniref:Fe-S cluster biogenesis protein NfuA, 4Fe-4S-binding domain n=1 Tax=Insolitispirillum peregrinum TaxID=80876 RepID=A0A1N7MU88_9PROT|nr:NifU family protein [Insolitispirillum peregrinum]SIS89622.1 Fe-S cluster biogenesis protein NfuA, 4Fe-4S-binding domain [Insolitispirillum peregrinum]
MFIQTEPTPNPASLKFIPGRPVLASGSSTFTSIEQATHSPLAQRLFAITGVDGVFLGGDFITVTKAEARDWQVMKPMILGAIMEHYTSGQPVVLDNSASIAANTVTAEDSDVVAQIKELIDTRVRPVVARDGGDITYHDFKDGVVYLVMRGSCSGCPSSTATLKHGIENMLRHYIPEVQAVEAVS